MINSKGQLGVATSSSRYKDDIKPMNKTSEAILSLQPVTFRYKKELDSLGTPQFGLVAEQVAQIDPDLVARDETGKPYTVRYEAVNAMLLNEFLKAHRTIEEQQGEIGELKAAMAEMKATVKAQAAQIQTVSAQVRESESPRLVSTNR
jgi:methyl-accepting chemotaxis protein